MTKIDGLVTNKTAKEMLLKLSLDRLTVCFNEPNKESVKKTCDLLLSEYKTGFVPGMVVTKNPLYNVSCQIPLLADSQTEKCKVCFEAGPTRPDRPSFRLDFNPSKLSLPALDELMANLEGWIDENPTIFLHSGKVTRCDVALDIPGYCNEDVLVRTSRLQKRALKPLDASQRKSLKSAYEAAQSLLPSLDDLWATWPNILISYGLGKELGAIPLEVFTCKVDKFDPIIDAPHASEKSVAA